MTKGIKEEISNCKAMLQESREKRLIIQKTVPYDIESYLKCLSQSQALEKHLEVLKKNVEDILFLAKTQATADLTGYRGLVDWAKIICENHQHLIVTLAQVAFVGAGLTYTSIFSATRGNLGIMCYAFALFDCGFIFPTVALALLKWASCRSKDALFACPQIWSMILSVFIYGSVVAVGVAICLLNVSIMDLYFPVGNDGQRMDSGLQLDIPPKPAGMFALVYTGVTGAVISVALLLHYMVNGWDTMINALFGRVVETPGRGLNSYVPT
ncbi:hypothetical protein BJ138DRAFT_544057 [Hygrophoropsis aurantiaca]|uniref:Uncharacterized protein n=1 Tax=Hygrophoropsis aurantiaca TaxID=72124 RepID=A0ACB8A260_9AGAM|nr:hypothetical protein BJ138DRAFT_544057 [Hygrophoropsis aurantiaca]